MNEFKFVETNSETITNKLINYTEEYLKESLPIGDNRRQMLQVVSYILVGFLNHLNRTGLNNLLRYAVGDALDEIGQLLGVKRLKAEPSTVTLKFTLSSAQPTEVIIPKGTRATADSKVFFATDEELTIASGTMDGTVTATATEAGAKGNGFVEGQIINLVDGVSYVGAVTNTTASADGRDIENDDDFRERIRIAPFSFSTAGAEEAYRYLALTANPNIGDVDIYRASAGNVTVAIVKKDGTLPDDDDVIITDVLNACNAKTKRPLTDEVVVKAATPIEQTIDITYTINQADSGAEVIIHEAVKEAVNEYKLWQTTKIGRDINPDRLRKLVLNAGADTISINSPSNAIVGDGEVAQFTDVSIAFDGFTE